MDLTEFLLERIADDEAAVLDEGMARASAGTVVLGPVYDDNPDREAVQIRLQEAVIDVHRKRPWASPWPPVRVLAECEAKRRIVEHEKITAAGGDYIPAIETTWTLRVLALPYADHPDYRDEWRP